MVYTQFGIDAVYAVERPVSVASLLCFVTITFSSSSGRSRWTCPASCRV